jgi:hypothetical protein
VDLLQRKRRGRRGDFAVLFNVVVKRKKRRKR